MGVMTLADAIAEAKSRGLDLVEVAPQATPVVCKFLDFGKYKYKQEKLERKKHKTQKLKEMRFTSRIDDHDFMTKANRIKKFLAHEDKVKVTVIFRGREIVHMDRGRELLNRLAKEVESVGKVDQGPMQRGRTLQMLFIPAKTQQAVKENNNAEGQQKS